ncbi:MAG: signal peptidase II [Deltaproteobacteria bacterium]|nr:signal peptidase II [Deltaproteobacteria bacterium]
MRPPFRKACWTLVSAAAALALDLCSKRLVAESMDLGTGSAVAPFFNLVLVQNTGAAFSMLSGTGAGHGLKLALLSLLAMIPLAVFYCQARDRDRPMLVALGAILGGALGNIHDRVRFGAVTDFLDLHWGEHHWPAFNLADVFVVAGIVWLLGVTLKTSFKGAGRPPGGRAPSGAEAEAGRGGGAGPGPGGRAGGGRRKRGGKRG